MRRTLVLAAVLCACSTSPVVPVSDVRPVLATDAAAGALRDPAIWVNLANPAESRVLAAVPDAGSLVVFGLDGTIRQSITGLRDPIQVDVEYGMKLGAETADIAVVVERGARQLRIWRIDAESLVEMGTVPVFDGESGDAAIPAALGLYWRSTDGAVLAIVGRMSGPKDGILWEYRLTSGGPGQIQGRRVRTFGRWSGKGPLTALAVDDHNGAVYYADPGVGIRHWPADPASRTASREIGVFGAEGFTGDRSALAVWSRDDGSDTYLLCAEQLPGASKIHIFSLEGRRLKIVRGGADSSDGLAVSAAPLDKSFPRGLLVAANPSAKNLLFFRWDHIAGAGAVRLAPLAP